MAGAGGPQFDDVVGGTAPSVAASWTATDFDHTGERCESGLSNRGNWQLRNGPRCRRVYARPSPPQTPLSLPPRPAGGRRSFGSSRNRRVRQRWVAELDVPRRGSMDRRYGHAVRLAARRQADGWSERGRRPLVLTKRLDDGIRHRRGANRGLPVQSDVGGAKPASQHAGHGTLDGMRGVLLVQ